MLEYSSVGSSSLISARFLNTYHSNKHNNAEISTYDWNKHISTEINTYHSNKHIKFEFKKSNKIEAMEKYRQRHWLVWGDWRKK